MPDRIFSARINESTIRRIANLAKRLKQSKKQIVESAVQEYSDKLNHELNVDILKDTAGAWEREERPAQTVEQSREAFRRAMNRHQE